MYPVHIAKSLHGHTLRISRYGAILIWLATWREPEHKNTFEAHRMSNLRQNFEKPRQCSDFQGLIDFWKFKIGILKAFRRQKWEFGFISRPG